MNILQQFLALLTRKSEPQQYRRTWVPSRQAGVAVDHDTALTYSAVWACVRVISEDLAKLPWRAYRMAGDRREHLPDSAVERVLNVRPNPEMSAFAFRETLTAWALTWGNGYAEIERDMAGRVQALWPISPDRVEVKRDRDTQRLYYEISNNVGGQTILSPDQVFHLHGLGFDGLVGYSVVAMARRTLGIGIASEEFGANFFGNGTVTSMTLEHPGKLSDQSRENLRESLNKRHSGPHNAWRFMILEEGMKANNVGIPPADAQFLETRKFQTEEVCRWFRVPPHKIADLERATFSNIEHQSIEYVQDTLMPWATRLEQEAAAKLIGQRSAVDYTKISLNALMRGDHQARANFYRELLNIGVMSPNEIRSLEELDPYEGGDKYVMQMNMTTMDKIGQDEEPEVDTITEDDIIEAHRPMILASIERIRERRDGEKMNIQWAREVLTSQLLPVCTLLEAPGAVEDIAAVWLAKFTDSDQDAESGTTMLVDTIVDYALAHRLREAI